MRIAVVSGGKDSIYATLLYGNIDLGVVFVYEFPRPSPHLLNIGKSIETLLLMGIPSIVIKLNKGREKIETIEILKKLRAEVIVAGDVYVDDHLKYMQSIADEIGAKLIEPLWGLDPVEVLYKEMEYGITTLFIGGISSLSNWIGKELSIGNVDDFIGYAKSIGIDPLGERGEYHTLVIYTPKHIQRLRYEVVRVDVFNDYLIARVI